MGNKLKNPIMTNKNSTYKRLGDYIREVDVRNRDLQCTNLLGLSIAKAFIPSIANTVGTDLRSYKIVKHNQFAYVPVTSRNGEKITIALFDGQEDCIISQAYTSFEVKDAKELLPEYLMMWFRRPEFDRYARFNSHGSAREVFEWEEMCNVMMPIPDPAEQQRIVDKYNAIQARIENNKRIIAKLEETAQALYRKMFVDDIDLEHLPEGWRMGTVGEVVVMSQGIQVDVDCQFVEAKEGYNRFIRIIDYTPNTEELPRYVDIQDKRYYCTKDDIVMIRYGDAGTVCRRLEGIIANNLFKIVPIDSRITNNFLYYFLSSNDIQQSIKGSSASSTMPAITHNTIKELNLIIPDEDTALEFSKKVQVLENEILLINKENNLLTKMLSPLMVGMG